MLFIPYKKLTLYSELNADSLIKALQENTEPYYGFWFDTYYLKPFKPYQGRVGGRTFYIRPIFRNQNSFVPTIYGNIEESVNGSIITITFRLAFAVSIFLASAICLMVFSIIKYHEMAGMLFILFLYLMTFLCFNLEYSNAKGRLEKIFVAKVV